MTNTLGRFYVTSSLLILFFNAATLIAQNRTIKFIAHSHNDYEQDQPVSKALSLGFTSLEVDVMLCDGRLVVSHDDKNLASKPSFEIDYLKPIFKAITEKTYDNLYLLIDIKDQDLKQVIVALQEIFEESRWLGVIQGKHDTSLKLIVSGIETRRNRIMSELPSYLYIDGRLSDLDTEDTSHKISWISARFSDVTSWRGTSRPTPSVIAKLKKLVDKTHAQGKKLRFWGIPETPIVWHTLIALGVDVISVDDLDAFHKATSFLK